MLFLFELFDEKLEEGVPDKPVGTFVVATKQIDSLFEVVDLQLHFG